MKVDVPLISDVFARGHKPDFFFWVGCAGAYAEMDRIMNLKLKEKIT